MITLLLASQLHVFAYAYGTPVSLAWTLASERKKAVAILMDERIPTLKSTTIKFLDEENLISRVGRSIGLEPKGKKIYAFAPSAWPKAIFSRRYLFDSLGRNPNLVDKWPRALNADGTLTIGPGTKPLGLDKTLEGPWVKPVQVAPFFQNFRVAVAADSQAPQDILKTIAAAIGAKANLSGSEWKLEFDGREFRARLVALLKERADNPPKSEGAQLWVADANLSLAALDLISDSQLEKAANDSKWEFEFALTPGSPLYTAGMNRIQIYAKTNFSGGSGSRYVSQLDVSRPIQVVLNLSNSHASIQGMIKGDPTGGISF